MSFTEGNGGLSAADVAAVTGGYGNNGFFFFSSKVGPKCMNCI